MKKLQLTTCIIHWLDSWKDNNISKLSMDFNVNVKGANTTNKVWTFTLKISIPRLMKKYKNFTQFT